MKSIKLVGLLVVAALAVTAAIATTAASAAVLCTTNEPCSTSHNSEEGQMLDTEDVLIGTAKDLVLTTSPKVTCTHSVTEVTISNANPVEGEVSDLEFSGCVAHTVFGTVNCSVQVQNLPYTGTLTAAGGGNGILEATALSGEPSAEVICGGFLECAFGNSKFTFAVFGGDPVSIQANNLPLKIQAGGFLCPSEALWDANYKATGSLTSIFVR